VPQVRAFLRVLLHHDGNGRAFQDLHRAAHARRRTRLPQ
jgi:hypothetical protein